MFFGLRIFKRKHKLAFTVVELLVVLFIIAVLTALLFLNYKEGKRKLALDRATNKLAQDIRRAQERAMSALEYSCGGDKKANGFGIYIGPDFGNTPESYILFANCPQATGEEQNYYYDDKDVEIDKIFVERGIVAVGQGDVNADGSVDVGDLGIITAHYGVSCSSPYWCSGADLDRDTSVDLEDFSIYMGHYDERGLSIVFVPPDPTTHIYVHKSSLPPTKLEGEGAIKVRWRSGSLYRKFIKINSAGLIDIHNNIYPGIQR